MWWVVFLIKCTYYCIGRLYLIHIRRAVWCLLWIFVRILTALLRHCTVFNDWTYKFHVGSRTYETGYTLNHFCSYWLRLFELPTVISDVDFFFANIDVVLGNVDEWDILFICIRYILVFFLDFTVTRDIVGQIIIEYTRDWIGKVRFSYMWNCLKKHLNCVRSKFVMNVTESVEGHLPSLQLPII